jgi:hypothetical protein
LPCSPCGGLFIFSAWQKYTLLPEQKFLFSVSDPVIEFVTERRQFPGSAWWELRRLIDPIADLFDDLPNFLGWCYCPLQVTAVEHTRM